MARVAHPILRPMVRSENPRHKWQLSPSLWAPLCIDGQSSVVPDLVCTWTETLTLGEVLSSQESLQMSWQEELLL